jgi:hypothetical protein
MSTTTLSWKSLSLVLSTLAPLTLATGLSLVGSEADVYKRQSNVVQGWALVEDQCPQGTGTCGKRSCCPVGSYCDTTSFTNSNVCCPTRMFSLPINSGGAPTNTTTFSTQANRVGTTLPKTAAAPSIHGCSSPQTKTPSAACPARSGRMLPRASRTAIASQLALLYLQLQPLLL